MPPKQDGLPAQRGRRQVPTPEVSVHRSAGMRSRRDAALRLPPYSDGAVDPLDDLAGLPIREPRECGGAEYAGDHWIPCRCRSAA
jgi:hypothetical protein